MGFSVERAKEMLEKYNGNVDLAVEDLASNLGLPDDEPKAGNFYFEYSALFLFTAFY